MHSIALLEKESGFIVSRLLNTVRTSQVSVLYELTAHPHAGCS